MATGVPKVRKTNYGISNSTIRETDIPVRLLRRPVYRPDIW